MKRDSTGELTGNTRDATVCHKVPLADATHIYELLKVNGEIRLLPRPLLRNSQSIDL